MTTPTKKRALRRLKIIEGQVRGLARMIEENSYCIDVLTQSEAVKKAISGVEDVILEHHLSTHVIEQIKSGKEKRAIEEILRVYTLSRGQ